MIKHEPEEVIICHYCNGVVKENTAVFDGHWAHQSCAAIAEKRRDKAQDYMAELKQCRLEKDGEL